MKLDGDWAEHVARRHALWRGATLVEANPRFSGGELDLVLRHWTPPHWGTLVFAEVKARRGGEALALAAVDARKQERVVRGAIQWLLSRGLDPAQTRLRFDVFAVTLTRGDRPRVTWLQNAFEA